MLNRVAEDVNLPHKAGPTLFEQADVKSEFRRTRSLWPQFALRVK